MNESKESINGVPVNNETPVETPIEAATEEVEAPVETTTEEVEVAEEVAETPVIEPETTDEA